jgi:HlyD family secretion protein
MKPWKTILLFLIIPALVLSIAACGTSNQPVAQVQKIPVTRGNLTFSVNGSGKIAVSTDANLSFGSGGTLKTLNVKEGDKVTKGAVLAALDTSSLEVQLAQARVAQDQARLAQTQAQNALNQAQLAQIQTKSALAAAQFNLDRTQAVSDIKDEITKMVEQIKYAEMLAQDALAHNDSDGANYWRAQKTSYQIEYARDQKRLMDLLSNPEYTGTGALTYNIMGQTYNRLTVEDVQMKELAVEAAQKAVDQSNNGITLGQQALDQSKDGIALTQQSLDYIQKQINDATITAPFDGVVVTLYHKLGDIIPSPVAAPQMIVYMVDNVNLEADVNIDEMDIPSIRIGQKAVVSVDALSGTTLEGRVFLVSTIPNTQAAATGVTAYTVKISFSAPQALVIKAGMNTSADIITGEQNNILLVPNQAIKTDNQGKNYVQMMNGDKAIKQTIVKGLSNKSETEVTSGLNEGDQVVTPVTDGKWSLH